jgi:predicted lipid carrier protein YhbT/chorismate mutase
MAEALSPNPGEPCVPGAGRARAALTGAAGARSRELRATRFLIDRVDEMVLVLWAGRRRLVRRARSLKRHLGRPVRDLEREREVHERAESFAAKLGLSSDTTRQLMELLMSDARALQGLPSSGEPAAVDSPRSVPGATAPRAERWLRLVPPPARLSAPIRWAVPRPLVRAVLRGAIARVLSGPLAAGRLDEVRGRRLGVEITDLKLRWVVEVRERELAVEVPGGEAEATVRGPAVDLLLLAGRLEDADTLFFQRRLQLVGDVELGLLVRHLLDRLPWETIPLDVRLLLHRGASFARAAHHGETIA